MAFDSLHAVQNLSELRFYIDDSGTRSPDRRSQGQGNTPDWFSLGGILVDANDEALVRERYHAFCKRWDIDYPLHSSDIRFRQGNFKWLRAESDESRSAFYGDLENFLVQLPVRGLACVIDRPGYNHRYFEQYGRERWSLCKTAFSVIAERAVKVAMREGKTLRVYAERSDRKADNRLNSYFRDLRENGMPFNEGGNSKYHPLSTIDFHKTFKEFRIKYKSSPMIQVADLYLYPMCRNGYESYRPFDMLRLNGRLLDCSLATDEVPMLGIKYSCFDLVERQSK